MVDGRSAEAAFNKGEIRGAARVGPQRQRSQRTQNNIISVALRSQEAT